MKATQVDRMILVLRSWQEHEEDMSSCGREAREEVAVERLAAVEDAIAALEALAEVE